MTLKQLAREVQDVVKDGIATLLVWKKGRSWCYETSYYDEGLCPPKEEADEYEALIERIKAVDEKYLTLNTYEYFVNDTLDYIAFQIKRLYEREELEEELTKAEILEEIDESIDVKVELNDEEAMFLSKFALNHYANSVENLGTKNPIFLVQTQEKRVVDTDIEEPDIVKFYVSDWCEEFNSLEEIVKEHYENAECPIDIISFEEAEGLPSFIDINGEEAWIFDRSDYLKAYGIEVDVTEVGMCYEYKTKAYFFIKEEAERYIKYQGHNLNKPRIYADGCGYDNKGEYEIFYNLLMKLGNIVNREERKERFRKFYSGKIC